MVSLVEHAEDSRTPEATAWLLGGLVAVALPCGGLASRALNPDDHPGNLLERAPGTLAAGAALAIAATAVRPAPVLLVGALVAVPTVIWLTLIVQFFAAGARVDRAHEPGETIGI